MTPSYWQMLRDRTPLLPEGLIAALSMLVIMFCLHHVSARPTYAEREAQIDALSPAEKDRLLRNYERFQSLDANERARIIRLQSELEKDPQRAELQLVLDSYYEWLKTLSPGQRAELQKLTPQERLARVSSLASRQAHERDRRHDSIILIDWLEERAMKQLAEKDRAAIAAKPPMQRRIMALDLSRQNAMGQLVDNLQSDEIKRLKPKLSARLQQQLDNAADSNQERRILLARFAELPRQMAIDGGSLFDGPALQENKQALQHFFEHDLSDEERDRLLSLPPDEMQRSLRRIYLARSFPEMFRDRHRWEPFVTRKRPGRSGDHRGDSNSRRSRTSGRGGDEEKASK